MSTEKNELHMEEMEKVSGGYVVEDGTGSKYWVVRQDGKVIGPAPTLDNVRRLTMRLILPRLSVSALRL